MAPRDPRPGTRTTRFSIPGHALRWVQETDGITTGDAYDAFNPVGPWTASCECGEWRRQVKSRREGRWFHKLHKVSVESKQKGASQ